jgi:transcriptional regulator with XRE-family HTH domain
MAIDELATRARQARKARGWTQQQLAEAPGVHLRTISGFERRETARPHPENLRAIIAALELEDDAAGDEVAADSREEWPQDVRVFLDVMGLFLSAIPESERQAIMHDLTRQMVGQRRGLQWLGG